MPNNNIYRYLNVCMCVFNCVYLAVRPCTLQTWCCHVLALRLMDRTNVVGSGHCNAKNPHGLQLVMVLITLLLLL